MDLGCGHGVVTRHLSTSFDQIFGTDPSPGMIPQASSSTSPIEHPNVQFQESFAEKLDFIRNESVDMVVSGQAAHCKLAHVLNGLHIRHTVDSSKAKRDTTGFDHSRFFLK